MGIFLADEPFQDSHIMTITESHNEQLLALLPRLRRFARALTGNMTDADDLVQTAVEKAITNMHMWQEGTHFDRWVITITKNCWLDDRRSARVRMPHDDVSERFDLVGEDGRETADKRARQAELRKAVDALPDEQRAVVALVIIEGFSYRETADALDIPLGTVMSRLGRARAVLMTKLGGALQ
jgi:RNA polymerase sigma-70 factor, ECF subfamily